ncbi:MAG TPA: fibronectin type III domain-containing protein [Candidatus Acidoferrales bacterium]|jgi:hypothetical protein|nr:fibronectin type III domain-containing protein [Candidatus Acidoferrales bacterium]
MKQGDRKTIGKKRLIIAILSGFLLTALPVIAQNLTLGLGSLGNVGVNLSQGLSLNANLQLPIQSLALGWSRSVSPNVVGYDIYYGGLSGIYTNKIVVGNVTNLTIPGLIGGDTYYFVVTAVNNVGLQSGYSSQLPYTLSTAPVLGAPVFSSNGFSFAVSGTSGSNCVIQVSTNLINWVPLVTNAVPFQFTDSNANHFSKRFYRAVYP